MKFFDYLKSKEVAPPQLLLQLRDTAATNKRTLYQELFLAGSNNKYGITYAQLEQHIVDAGKSAGISIKPIYTSAGCMCDDDIYTALGGVTEQLASYFLPLSNEKTGELLALTNRPDDSGFREKLDSAYRDKPYVLSVCSPAIWNALYALYIEPLLLSSMAMKFGASASLRNDVSETARSSEARQFYQKLLNVGVDRHASDVHFIPCSDECQVLFRIDGVNTHYTNIPKDVSERICNILKSDGAIPTKNPHDPLDGKVRFSPSQGEVTGDEIDLRVSIIPTKGGSDLNVRYLSSKLYTFDELGMSRENVAAYKELLDLQSGLVVQVGPTGSGKSTTLYAGLDYIHKSLRNVITVEDPVEILMEGISQIDVNADGGGGLVFSSALKAMLRHDPDVVVVGELRDPDTAFEAIRAANTGHLVLTSLHTNDSVGAFERLINLGIDSYSLGEVIAAVMGQRLVRRLCPHCKEEYQLDLKSDLAKLYRLPNQEGVMRFFRPVGCVHCNNTGYKGRIAINEVLVVDGELRTIIQRHGIRSVIEEYLRSKHFQTMYQDGLNKTIEGVTSLEEMNKFAKDTIAFKG